jgi:chemotaxis protein MotB
MPNPVRVEGNTDNVPISTAEFHSNWDLSTSRADAVLEFLLAHGVAPNRLSATGYADQRPIATNATADGRSLNRRVELVVLRRNFNGGGGSP